jgi:hypothetical protein
MSSSRLDGNETVRGRAIGRLVITPRALATTVTCSCCWRKTLARNESSIVPARGVDVRSSGSRPRRLGGQRGPEYFGLDEQVACLQELVRVTAGEVRVCPLVDGTGTEYPGLDRVRGALADGESKATSDLCGPSGIPLDIGCWQLAEHAGVLSSTEQYR